MHRMNLKHCLVGIAVGVLLFLAWGGRPGTLVLWAAVLACPLMMVLMMGGMGRHGNGRNPQAGEAQSQQSR